MANRGLNLPSTGRAAGMCLLALERQRDAPVTLHVRPHSTHPTNSSLTFSSWQRCVAFCMRRVRAPAGHRIVALRSRFVAGLVRTPT
jgi:hypothetical protein